MRRFFCWIADRWFILCAYCSGRRDTIGTLIVQMEDMRERHRREIEMKDSIISLNTLEKKALLEIIELHRAQVNESMAVLTRRQAEAEYSVRRSPSAGGIGG